MMEKTYQPKQIEQALYQIWEQSGHFKPSGHGMAYSIMLPPPNVTGSLHMGHGFQQTLMDVLIRYHRMQGDNTLWQAGTDHAGIATQMVVENQLHAQGKSRYDLGREAFVDKVWKWKAESGGMITQQMRRLGTSPDWSRERFTMDDGLSDAVQEAFIRLYDEGLIYRGKRLVNWDPVLHTAVSDLEVINTEEQGSMWHIRYPLASGKGELIVATTRPETMLGDVAVAVHPADERYQHLIGQQIKLPLTDRTIPIIADEYVDPAFGTGCVKITPAHDFNDYEVGKRHKLELINIFTLDAIINDNAPKAYQGLDRVAARKQIVADLEQQGFLDKIQPHTLKVPRNDRGNAILEPCLMDQWYVSTKSLAEPAIKAVEEGRTKFVPENWSNTYFEWMRNIQDWCISRQLWWGHRIPAWYDESGKIYVAQDEATVRSKYKLATDIKLRQDEDVLDTWFSSALWPFSTLGWPNNLADVKTFYPTSVLVTGFDIIFFWVARMMMFGLKFIGDVPFKTVYITGLIRDAEGQKMSKTKGNVLDPIDLIDGIELDALIKKRTYGMMQPRLAEKITKATQKEFPEGIAAYGTDALRFTYCALASTSRDISFNIQRMEGYRNFCNKLWNATRFVVMQLDAHHFCCGKSKTLNAIDHWIWSQFNDCAAKVHQAIAQYRFDWVAETLYEFVWNQYCDWYLELAKVTLNNPNATAAEKNGTCYTLLQVLEKILRLAHPVIPFITESIWLQIKDCLHLTEATLMLAQYPQAEGETHRNHESIDWLQQIVTNIRMIRSQKNFTEVAQLSSKGANTQQQEAMKPILSWLLGLGRISKVNWLETNDSPPLICFSFRINGVEFYLHVNLTPEAIKETIAGLEKELSLYNQEIDRFTKKLSNAEFVSKAPPTVITKEKEKLHLAEQAKAKILVQIENLKKS